MKEKCAIDKIQSPLFDAKTVLCALMNMRLLDYGVYMGLPSEDWATKIMLNIIINHSNTLDENQKELLTQASQLTHTIKQQDEVSEEKVGNKTVNQDELR